MFGIDEKGGGFEERSVYGGVMAIVRWVIVICFQFDGLLFDFVFVLCIILCLILDFLFDFDFECFGLVLSFFCLLDFCFCFFICLIVGDWDWGFKDFGGCKYNFVKLLLIRGKIGLYILLIIEFNLNSIRQVVRVVVGVIFGWSYNLVGQ